MLSTGTSSAAAAAAGVTVNRDGSWRGQAPAYASDMYRSVKEVGYVHRMRGGGADWHLPYVYRGSAQTEG